MSIERRLAEIRDYYGARPRFSPWLEVTQEVIDQFGSATLDGDWLHTDPERAKRESPFGGTIAYGFWTLSMLTHLNRQTLGHDYPPGTSYGLNYGFDRVRFVEPVPVGCEIRGSVSLRDAKVRNASSILVTTENTISVRDAERPSLVADWLVLLVYL